MATRKRLLIAMLIAPWLAGAYAVTVPRGSARDTAKGAAPKDDAGSASLGEIRAAYEKLASRYEDLSQSVTALDQHLTRVARFDPPVGTILAYAGDWPAEPGPRKQWEDRLGWMLCDGRELPGGQHPRADPYRELSDAIGTHWGGTDGSFRLPDTQGLFLRGVSGNSNRDPEAAARTPSVPGGAQGNSPGSFQDQSFLSHKHDLTDPGHGHKLELGRTGRRYSGGGDAALDDDFRQGDEANKPPPPFLAKTSTTGITMGYSGGQETRPKNVAVHWIIKFKSG